MPEGHEKRKEALEAGMQSVLSKPAKPDELKGIIEQYVFSRVGLQNTKQAQLGAGPNKALDIIDWVACEKMLGGDRALVKDMLHMLSAGLKKTEQAIDKYIIDENAKDLRDELHRIRGGVCYVKVPQLEQALKVFHEVVKNNTNREEIENSIKDLKNSIFAFRRALEN